MREPATGRDVLQGPFRLLVDDIRKVVRGDSCGVYALGSRREDGLFAVSYVGAEYSDVAADLCNRIGTAPFFKYRAYTDPEKAFLALCQLFHSFHPSGNFFHPERPKGSRIGCPHCDPRQQRIAAAALRR